MYGHADGSADAAKSSASHTLEESGSSESVLTETETGLERLWLCEIVSHAARDLERLAAQPQRSLEDKAVLLRRAALLRVELHKGPPPGWDGSSTFGGERSDDGQR